MTDRLADRPSRQPDFAAENRAMVAIARAMADAPGTVMQRIAELALALTGAHGAGISVLEPGTACEVFRWHAAAGSVTSFRMGCQDRDASPCSISLASGSTELLAWPVRQFPEVASLGRPVHEALHVPFGPTTRPAGVLWLLSHDDDKQFDAEDARVLQNLAAFAAAALAAMTLADDGASTEHGLRARAVEQAAVDAAVQRLAEQRRLALDSADLGWWHVDAVTNLVMWDDRFKTIFGVSGDRLAYDKLIRLIHPDDVDRVDAAVKAATRTESPEDFDVEYRIHRPDGQERWIAARGRAHYEGADSQRRYVSLVGTVADITDARLAQDALRESERRFRQLADAMPQIVWAARPDGTVDYYNREWYDYTGQPEGGIGDASWAPVLPEEDVRRIHDVWGESIRTGRPYEIEYRFRRASDGEYRWHLGRARPVRDESGRIVRWFGTNTDIHDHKLLQQQNAALLDSERAARSEAERQGRMKDEFLATLGHELRTPLNAVLGWSQILRAPDVTREDIDNGIDVIERNARAQAQIIEDLLDMSRIISGKVLLETKPIDLAATLNDAVESTRPMAAARGLDLDVSVAPNVSFTLGDANRLRQVFWNLLSNAVKFTPRGGRVGVKLRQRRTAFEIRVEDNGVGIAADFLPHVFDRFRQADATTTRVHGGLGLGLSIVKQLVELHGGSIQAMSDGPDRGAAFTVILPLVIVDRDGVPAGEVDVPAWPARTLKSVAAARATLKGVTVLVIDDESDSRAMVKRVLEDCDARVHVAASAAEGLSLMPCRPTVIVSDVGMPGEDGYSFIRRVRQLSDADGGRVPALALTAYARQQDHDTALASGFDRHAAKPIEAADLVAAVAGLAGR